MTDQNRTRGRYHDHQKAFIEVLGDPFAAPEPIDGWYNLFHRKSSIGAARYDDNGHATGNAARPTLSDFFCDVDNVIEDIIPDKIVLQKFITTYIVGDIDSSEILDEMQRSRTEQRMGRLFIARNIVPVSQYFKTVRLGSIDKLDADTATDEE